MERLTKLIKGIAVENKKMEGENEEENVEEDR